MRKLSISLILVFLISCSQEKFFIRDFVSEAFHQAIGLEKLNDINSLIDRDTIYVFPYRISLLKGRKETLDYSTLIPRHTDKWYLKIVDKIDLDGFIKKNKIQYLNLYILEKKGDITISLEKAFKYSAEEKGMITETEGIKIVFKKTNYQQITDIIKYRNMLVVDYGS